MLDPKPFATRSRSVATRRFARDVIVSVAIAGVGTLSFSVLIHSSEPPPPRGEAKLTERLSFVQEDVPVRETRIYDTLAMFAEPQGEPSPWSDKPLPFLKVADAPPASTSSEAGRMTRMTAAEARGSRQLGVRPPARPIRSAEIPSALSAAAPPVAAARETPIQMREPVRVFGWSVPGTQVLPTRRDAFRAVARIGDAALEIGSGTVDVVGGTASSVGRTVTSLGGNVAESIGWR